MFFFFNTASSGIHRRSAAMDSIIARSRQVRHIPDPFGVDTGCCCDEDDFAREFFEARSILRQADAAGLSFSSGDIDGLDPSDAADLLNDLAGDARDEGEDEIADHAEALADEINDRLSML